MSLLRIDASIRGDRSASRALADIVQQQWSEQHPDDTVVSRDLARSPIPAAAWIAGTAQDPVDAAQTPEQRSALALARALFEEVVGADSLLIASGLYNWGLNQLVKGWIDQILIVASPLGRILEGKQVVVVVARGGDYGEDGSRAGWDHGTPWLMRILSDVWGAKVTLVERDLALAAVDPACDDYNPRAAAAHQSALHDARCAGKSLASRGLGADELA